MVWGTDLFLENGISDCETQESYVSTNLIT